MEEKNMTSPNETKEVKKVTPKQSKHSEGKERDGFIVKSTATVIVTSLIVGVIITCMDTVFSAGYDTLINLLG